MKLISFTCPGCGAHLNVDANLQQATCEYCGMSFPVDDEAQHVKFDGAEQAGYEFEKGRQRAQQEQAQPQTVYVQVVPEPPKKKRKTWLWVLGWIFIFPVPLTVIMLNNESVKQKLKPPVRYAIIAVAWLLYLAIGLSGGGKDSSKGDTSSRSSSVVASQTASSSPSASASSAPTSAGAVSGSASDATPDEFVAAVQEAITGAVSTSQGEAVTDVSLKDGELVVKVDIGNSYDGEQGAGNFTRAQLVALDRFSSITDAVLRMNEYAGLWDTVTVDFGANGSITKKQSEAVDSKYGRYFDVRDEDLNV